MGGHTLSDVPHNSQVHAGRFCGANSALSTLTTPDFFSLGPCAIGSENAVTSFRFGASLLDCIAGATPHILELARYMAPAGAGAFLFQSNPALSRYQQLSRGSQ
jgi:hypothetical protein